MKRELPIPITSNHIRSFCRRYHIRKLSLFGSVLNENFRPDSDIDVLVEFDLEHVPGFLRLYQMEDELSAILGNRKVDLVTLKSLNHRLRPKILSEALVQYAEG